MPPEPEFTVWEFYPDGTHHAVKQWCSGEEAVALAHASTRKPAVALGIIVKVTITDSDDFCVFEWQAGKGVTYPPLTPDNDR